MPGVTPESCWYVRFSQLRSSLQKLFKKLLIAAVEERLLRGVVDVEDLEEDAEDDGHEDEDVHLDPLLQRHALTEGLEGGHASLVDLGLYPVRTSVNRSDSSTKKMLRKQFLTL